jgi:hypothetical protein
VGSAATPASGEFIHWVNLTLEQRRGIFPAIEAGNPVHIFSETLDEVVWWTRDEQTAEALKQDPRYQGEVIYTLAELRELAGQGPEFLRDIHRLKRTFNATLQKTVPKPALRAGLAFITVAGEGLA